MRKLKCLIVDDEPLARELIATHIRLVEELEVVAKCSHALEAMSFLRNASVDVIFLDIQMPKLTGIDFLKTLRTQPKVVFTTAYKDYAIEAFELDVVDYLLKPITFERFLKTVEKLLEQKGKVAPTLEASASESKADEANFNRAFIYLKTSKKNVKIFLDEILYIESMKDYVKVFTKEACHVSLQKISSLETKLSDTQFLRIHRSFIVGLQHLTAYTPYDVEIGEKEIPIGRNYKTQVVKVLETHLL